MAGDPLEPDGRDEDGDAGSGGRKAGLALEPGLLGEAEFGKPPDDPLAPRGWFSETVLGSCW